MWCVFALWISKFTYTEFYDSLQYLYFEQLGTSKWGYK